MDSTGFECLTLRPRRGGFFAWLAWLFIHLLFLIGFRNKLSVLLAWTHSYWTFKRGARVIYGFPPGER